MLLQLVIVECKISYIGGHPTPRNRTRGQSRWSRKAPVETVRQIPCNEVVRQSDLMGNHESCLKEIRMNRCLNCNENTLNPKFCSLRSNLITLCNKHHGKTNGHRGFYAKLLQGVVMNNYCISEMSNLPVSNRTGCNINGGLECLGSLASKIKGLP